MRKIKWIKQLLAIGLLYYACSKPHEPMVTTGTSTGDTIPVIPDSLGAGWQLVTVDTSRHFSDIFFVNNQTGFICGQNYIGKSTDGGLTWTSILPSSLSGGFINLFFTDANNGWVFGSRTIRTTDGGSTWQGLSISNTFDGQFFDANNGYITTINGGLFKTTDGGATTHLVINANQQLRVLFFSDSTHGWLSSSNVFKTNDGCASFQQLAAVNVNDFYAAQFTDSLHGWTGGPVIYKTLDGGATFQKIIAGASGGDMHFFDNNNGYILSGNRIYSTTNGGQTLVALSRFKTGGLWEIHFTDPNHGWVVADGGYIYRYVKP